MNVSVSVIMSVFNSEFFLKESVESVLNQTFTDFEFLIVDDNSQDNSYKILEGFAKKDKRIKLYCNEENLGLTKSLNKLLKLAKGKYIARIDADDISLLNRFQLQFDFLEKNVNVFLSGTYAVEIDAQGKELKLLKSKHLPEELKNILEKQNAMIHSSIMFRNEKIFFYREKFIYAQDYDFYLCLLTNDKKIANIPKVLIKYRKNDNSISIKKGVKQRLFAQKANYFYHERLKYKKDSYDKFCSNDILSADNKIVIESEIYLSIKTFNKKLIRERIRVYFSEYGFFNKFLLYFIISYFSENLYLRLKKMFSL